MAWFAGILFLVALVAMLAVARARTVLVLRGDLGPARAALGVAQRLDPGEPRDVKALQQRLATGTA